MSFQPLPRAFRDCLAACDRDSACILDLGCGEATAWAASLHRARPLGLDRMPPWAGTAAAVVGDALRPPLRPAACDLLVASNLFRHILKDAAPASILRCWQGLLRPEGVLFLFEDEPQRRPAAVRNYRDLQAFLARLDPRRRGPLLPLEEFRRLAQGGLAPDAWRVGQEKNLQPADPDRVVAMLRGAGAAPQGEAARLIASIETGGLDYGQYWWAAWKRPRQKD